MRHSIQTRHLNNTVHDIRDAAQILHGGGLVAFPTETVYGLGADATNGEAVARIYEAKDRPSFNPLIIHVHDLDIAKTFAHLDDTALMLANAFWPGPLSIVLPVKEGSGLSELVTAGLDTVAVRIPHHTTALNLLKEFGGALAAPSANPSGQISPTTQTHVLAGLDGKIDAVIGGGACTVGLESTIVTTNPKTELFRHGGVSLDKIEDLLGYKINQYTQSEKPSAPGQLQSHYAPNAMVFMNVQNPNTDQFLIGFGEIEGDLNLSLDANLREAAANLFAYLHLADDLSIAAGKSQIAVAPIPQHGLGVSINDRLIRASAPRP